MLKRRVGVLSRLTRMDRRAGVPGRRSAAVLLAFSVPLALAGAPGAGGQVRWPSPLALGDSAARTVARLADWVTGDHTAPSKGPAQRYGRAGTGPHEVPAAVTRAVARAEGRAAGQGRGAAPAYHPHFPARHRFTTGAAPGTGGYDAKTSVVDTAGSTATSILYKNADGSYSRQVFAAPVNYKTGSGKWARIDTGLVAGSGGRWKAKANALAVSFAAKADDASLASVAGTDKAGKSFGVGLGLAGAASVKGTASGSSVRYQGALRAVGVTATDTATGASVDLVLKSASAQSSWVFPLSLHGVTAHAVAGGSVDLVDSLGKVAGIIPAGVARDSAAGAGQGSGAAVSVPWKVVPWHGGAALKGSVPASWLDAPSRVFPVTVDPQVNEDTTGSTYVMNPFTADYSGDALLTLSGIPAYIRELAAPAAGGAGGGGGNGVPPAVGGAAGCPSPPGSGVLPPAVGVPGSGQNQGSPVPGGQSFTAGTRVLLPGGKTAPISSLKPGEKVLAVDTATGKNQPEAVTAVLVRRDHDLYDLRVKTARGTEVLRTTAGHLFYNPYLKQWRPASKLRKGERLRTADGVIAVADGGTTPAKHDGWMWDLTVPGNGDHDFYVLPANAVGGRAYHAGAGATPVLAHNTDTGCGPAPEDIPQVIFRTGSRTENALTDSSGVSFRNSVSSSLSEEYPQVFKPGDKIWSVNTGQLPPGSVAVDNVPPGHVSVFATPAEINAAVVPSGPDNFLEQLGLKMLEEFGSYRLPR